jgi:hypothetical protein
MPRQLPPTVILLNELVEKIIKDLGVSRQIYLGITTYTNVLIQMVKTQLTVQTSYKEICNKAWEIYQADVETKGKDYIIEIIKHYYNTKMSTQQNIELLKNST